MLIDLAESLTPLLKSRQERITSGRGVLRDGFDEEEAAETTLQLIFFDGEEAFHDWTATDSIYGARQVIKAPNLKTQLYQVSPMPPLNHRAPFNRFCCTDIDVARLVDTSPNHGPSPTSPPRTPYPDVDSTPYPISLILWTI